MRFAASASFDSVRPQIVTAAPSAASRSAQARPMPVPPPVTRTAIPSRPPEGRVRWAIGSSSVADAVGALAEDGGLLVDDGLQRGAPEHAVEEAAQPREAPALGRDARVAQVHVRARDRDVRDREARPDEVLALAELALEVLPELRELLRDGLLGGLLGGGVDGLAPEQRREHERHEDLRARDRHEAAVDELLEPERACVLEVVARIERRARE